MSRVRPARILFAIRIVFTIGFALAPSLAARAEDEAPPRPVVYKWIDENGIPHYTAHLDRVPSSVRDRVSEMAPSQDAAADSWISRDATPPESGAAAASAPPSPAPAPTATAPAAAPAPEASEPEVAAGEPEAAATSSESATATAAPEPSDDPAAFRESPSPAQEARLAPAEGDLDQRIAALEAEIARDEEALKDLLSQAPAESGAAIADQPEFREIAKRLPKLQADLRALREERSRSERR
jgi:hypothetical protein